MCKYSTDLAHSGNANRPVSNIYLSSTQKGQLPGGTPVIAQPPCSATQMSYLAHGGATAVVTIPQTGRQPSQLFNSPNMRPGLHKPQDVHTSAPRRGFRKHPHLQS